MRANARRVAGLIVAVWLAGCAAAPPTPWLEPVEAVAPGVDRFRSTDPTLVEPAAPITVHLLRLDPSRVVIESALAHGKVTGPEPVEGIAERAGALAAVNGGFFNVKNGDPTGVLKVRGELVSDYAPMRGAVAIGAPSGRAPLDLLFDRVSARVSIRFKAGGRDWSIPVDGVDTTRARGKLMLYTPAYDADTDTAGNGTEWVLDGSPLRVVDVQSNVGAARIPRTGVALSYGGLELPDALRALADGVTVVLETTWKSASGQAEAALAGADHIVGGAGLLRRAGEVVREWSAEGLKAESFIDVRHPRTMIGKDREGFIWLAAVDGRSQDSVGMTFADLERLAARLSLTDALNLDGGGSTTMVVKGRVINAPSDPTGPRPVSDAIVVRLR